jgi:DNA primase large subunit
MDLLFSSRYPFSAQAKELVGARKGGLTYEEIEAAKARVSAALGIGKLPQVQTRIDSVLEREIFSYAGARVIAACLQSRYFSGRFAVAESKRVGKYLSDDDDDATLARVAQELGVRVDSSAVQSLRGVKSPGAKYSVRFTDYLKSAPKDREYKLANKPLSGGMVTLSRQQLVRVVEEAARMRIEEAIPVDVSAIPEEYRKAAEEVRKQLPKMESFGGKIFVKEEDYPPCVKELIAKLRNSENLPHTARWFLATFLLQSGMKEEDVIALFRTAPDYDEHTTKYQVEYIARKGYRVPSCSSAESYGICVSACGARSPLSYSRRRGAATQARAQAEKGNA